MLLLTQKGSPCHGGGRALVSSSSRYLLGKNRPRRGQEGTVVDELDTFQGYVGIDAAVAAVAIANSLAVLLLPSRRIVPILRQNGDQFCLAQY